MVKLKGVALLENVVALLIVTLLIGIAMSFMVSVTLSNKSKVKFEAIALVNQEYYEGKNLLLDEEKEVPQFGFWIRKSVKPYKHCNDLFHVTYVVFDQNNLEVYRKKFLLLDE